MNELFREIEDDIRRERLDKLWNSFGKVMVGVSLAVVLGTVVIVVMQNRREARAMEQTTQFIKGVDRLGIEDYQGAIATFDELAADPHSSYYGLALLRKAQAQKALGDDKGATESYKMLANNDKELGSLVAMQLPDNAAFEPSRDSPFYYTQAEWKGWQLLEQGKKDEAVKQFLVLRDDAMAPMSMRQRLTEVLAHLAPAPADKKPQMEEKPDEQP